MSEIRSQGASGITMQAKPAEARADHDAAEAKLAAAIVAQGGAAEVELPADAEIILTQEETASTSVLILEKPPAGITETVVWTPGTPLVTRFALDSAASVVTEVVDGVTYTVFTWPDGAVLRVAGLDPEDQGIGDLPVTLEDGTVVGLEDFAAIAGVEPAAGPGAAAPGVAGPGNNGHGTGPAGPGDIGSGPGDTGPLGYTELFFSVPELTEDTDPLEEAAPAAPSLLLVNKEVDFVEGGGEGGEVDDAGDIIFYTITVENVGGTPLTNIVVADPFADGIEPELDNGFNVGDLDQDDELDPGEIWLYTASHVVTQAEIDSNGGGDGILQNVVIVTSDDSPPGSDDADVPVEFNPAFEIQKDLDAVEGGEGGSDDVVVSVGQQIFYTITVENIGNVSLTNVVVNDPFADGGVVPDLDNGFNVGDLDQDGVLDVNETWSYTATHTVTQDDLDDLDGDGFLINVATADTDQTDPESDDASVPILQFKSLDIEKAAALQDGGQAADEAGDVIIYTYTVTNTGNAAIANVVVVDDNATPTNTADDVTLTLLSGDLDSDGLLDVGETWNYSASYVVTQDDLDSGEAITNIAVVTGDDAIGDSDDATVEIDQNHSLNVEKSAAIQDGGPVIDDVGDVIIYTYTVTNTGNAAISGVVAVDDNATPSDTSDDITLTLDSGDTDSDGLLDVGEVWTYTSTYTVSEADFVEGATSIVNVVTVTSEEAPPDSDTETVPLDALPEGGEASATVFEAGNEETAAFAVGTSEAIDGNNTNDSSTVENASGNLNLSFGPDGPASAADRFDWDTSVTAVDSDDGNAAVTLTSGGFPVAWEAANNGETLNAVIQSGPNAGQIVATLTATPNGTNGMDYSYQQFGPFDHPDAGESGADDPIQLGFTYTIEDGNGTQTTGSLTVTVNDDAPAGIQGGDLVDVGIVKAESVQSGATGTNMAFVVDVSDSTTQTVPGGATRLSVEISAIKAVLQQAIDANVIGPVLLVAFHGNWTGGSNVEPRTFFDTYASAADAFAAVDSFFASLGGPPFGVDGGGAPQPGSTRWEGGLDVAADWFAGTLAESLPTDDGLPVGAGSDAVIQPNNVAISDNRIFFLTDGGNNNAAGGFTPTAEDVENLYTNVGDLTADIPNLTIRTVAVLNGDSDDDGTSDAAEYASIVDQSDDNLVNGSATIIDDEAGVTGIVAGFGTLVSNLTAEGNLFEDDDLIGGPGADGVIPVIGADDFQAMVSFTYQSGPNPENTTTVTSSGTFVTFLGGTIEVDFATGDYFYTAPTGSVQGTDHFTYVILDGDDDPQNGVLDILVGAGGTSAENAGFETDTLIFWSAAGAVWVEEDAKYSVDDGVTEGTHVGVIHTGNSLAAETNNTEITPDSDRTLYDNADLVGFIGQTGLTTLNNMGGIGGANGTVLDGSVLKGTFNVTNPGAVDVSFDWQFLTDHGINAGTSENDIAFVVIEGQLFLLANSDNLGTPAVSVLAAQNITIDSQTFTNATAFQDNHTITNITDTNGDGVINIAFGVVNAGATANAASALIIDDVQITPHV